MPTLPETRIAELLAPYLGDAATPPNLLPQLSLYLDLLLRWNARTNLTAIREPEEIVRRHFGESLFAGSHLAPLLPAAATLLDFGSGAGFPGLPIQFLLPQLRVTLAESQGKKASFLREAVRTLGLTTEAVSYTHLSLRTSSCEHLARFQLHISQHLQSLSKTPGDWIAQ